MKINVKIIMAAIVLSGLLTKAAYAQPAPLEGMSPREKARFDAKQKSDQQDDRAYKSTLGRIPDAKQKPDPWGNMRTPAPSAGAASQK
jgi:hypothetical protein